MPTWETIKENIKVRNTGSKAWKSDCNSLMEIIDTLDESGINPELMTGTKISNVRKIIPPMKVALKEENLKEAVHLLKTARDLGVVDLRLKMDPTHPKEIKFTTRRTAGEKMVHVVTFDHRQFKSIRNRLRDNIRFVEN